MTVIPKYFEKIQGTQVYFNKVAQVFFKLNFLTLKSNISVLAGQPLSGCYVEIETFKQWYDANCHGHI